MHSTRAFHLSLALLALAACGDDGDSGPRAIGGGCRNDSQCDPGLVCEFQLCHQPCEADSMCPGAQRCVRGLITDDAGSARHICQLDDTTECMNAVECLGKQVCASNECRDECVGASDCTSGQSCAATKRCYSNDPAKDTMPDGGA